MKCTQYFFGEELVLHQHNERKEKKSAQKNLSLTPKHFMTKQERNNFCYISETNTGGAVVSYM